MLYNHTFIYAKSMKITTEITKLLKFNAYQSRFYMR